MARGFAKNVIVRTPRKARADVLLVYPPWVNKNGRGTLQRTLPPLGLLSIAALLEAHGYEVHVVDLHAERMAPARFREIVRALRPRFVGITVLSPHVVPAHHVAKVCHEEVPDVCVVAGGVHAEAHPEHLLRDPRIDAVGRGDGEELMLEVVQGVPRERIAGLSYRVGGRYVHNAARAVNYDLDRLPFPAYHLVDFDLYFPSVGSYKDLPAMNVLMTRGCPGACSFCNSARMTLRHRSAEKMVELISLLRYRHGVRHIYFYDDTFTSLPKLVEELCERLVAARVDVRWTCFVRGDMFKDRLAALMARAGCYQVLLGIESGSEQLMADVLKPIAREKYREVVATAHRHGIEARGSFIVGHEHETPETLRETLEFAKAIDLDFFQSNVMTPYPGTQMFRDLKARGRLLHEDFTRYGQSEIVFRLAHMDPAEVLRFEERALWDFYMRPKVMWSQVRRLSNVAQLKDLARAAYVIAFDRIGRETDASQGVYGWLGLDLEAVWDRALPEPREGALTFEVQREAGGGAVRAPAAGRRTAG